MMGLKHLELLKKTMTQHGSFLALGVMSFAFFAASVVAKKTMSGDDFYYWNALITVLTVSFSFCFFGSEQILLRFARIEKAKVIVQRKVVYLMIGSLLFFSTAFPLIAEGSFLKLGSLKDYSLCTVSVGLFVFVYNYFRLLKSFVQAQVALNGWKLLVFCAVLLSSGVGVRAYLAGAMFLAVAITIGIYFLRREDCVLSSEELPNDWVSLFLSYAFSLALLVLLNNVDRFLFGYAGDNYVFSSYVYLVSLLLMPFSIVSNYFGFREAAFLKRSYKRSRFKVKAVRIFVASCLLFFSWFLFLYLLRDSFEIDISFSYLFPGVLIVSCRNAYSLYSALFGLHGSPKQIQIGNLMTLTVVVFSAWVVFYFGVNTLSVLIMLSVFWISRLSIYVWFTRKVEDYA